MSPKFKKKFWGLVSTPEGCWIWEGNLFDTGYGRIYSNGKEESAHRVSWMLFYGEIPPGLLVLHSCDNRPCVRPDHLFLGTHEDNTQDMLRKGRWSIKNRARGERIGKAQLTESDVVLIRKLDKAGYNRHEIADRLKNKVLPGQIAKIARRESWKHVL